MKAIAAVLVALAGLTFSNRVCAQASGTIPDLRRIVFTAVDAVDAAPLPLDSIRVLAAGIPLDTLLVGTSTLTLDVATAVGLPPRDGGFHVSGNFANPFTEQTQFAILSPAERDVTINLHASDGRRVAGLHAALGRGSNGFILHAAGLPAGLYILDVRDATGQREITRLVKLGTGGRGAVRFEAAGAAGTGAAGTGATGMGAALVKSMQALNLRVTGYAARHRQQTLDIAVSGDTTVAFALARAEEAPVITTFAADPLQVYTGDSVRFTVDCSDWDGDLAAIRVDAEDDGTVDATASIAGAAARETIVVAMVRAGTFAARLTVEDAAGRSAVAVLGVPIVVQARPSHTAPFFTAFTTDRNAASLEDTVRLTASVKDRDLDLARVLIDFQGDGSWDDSLTVAGGQGNASFAHVFRTPGTYSPAARVVDALGLSADTALPAAVAVRDRGKAPRITLFTASAQQRALGFPLRLAVMVEDADGDLDSLLLDIDADGRADTAASLAGHAAGDTLSYPVLYATTGAFVPSATATDAAGNRTTAALPAPIRIEACLPRTGVVVARKADLRAWGVGFDTSMTFTVPLAVAAGKGLRVGSILVSDTGRGVLRRVVDLDTAGQHVIAATVQGTLEELFEEVRIDVRLQLGADTVIRSLLPPGSAGAAAPPSFRYDYADFVLHGDSAGSVVVSGEVTIVPALRCVLDIERGTVRRFEFTAATSLDPSLVLGATMDLRDAQLRRQLARPPMKPITLAVGSVPLVLTPEIEVSLGMDGSARNDMRMSVAVDASLTVALRYDSGRWSAGGSGSRSTSFEAPHFANNAGARASLELRDGLAVFGVPCPSATATVSGDLDVDYLRTPLAVLRADVTGGAGCAAAVLGSSVADFADPRIVDTSAKIWESTGSGRPGITGIEPAVVHPGKILTIRGMGFGSSRGESYVLFDRWKATEYPSWSEGEIRVRVPAITAAGMLQVKVISADGRISESYPYGYRDWYIVGGRVTGTGVLLGGITITAGGRTAQTMTDGTFELQQMTPGSYTVTPSKTDYAFTPADTAITIVDQDAEGITFAARDVGLHPPVVTTASVADITETTARCGGDVVSDGNSPVTARGVCWSLSANPTVADGKTADGSGTGSYESNISGLVQNTTYHVRAYATNGVGTAYGNDRSFVTQKHYSGGTGSQVWMATNLNVTTYRNGDPIPQVTDSVQWQNLTTGAWCYYNNDPATGAIYGKLYNWHAVHDPRGLAPAGWHIPTDAEWQTLVAYLGGGAIAGGRMKEAGLAHWENPNEGADNSSGFTALPGGVRWGHPASGAFAEIGRAGNWWSATETDSHQAQYWYLMSFSAGIGSGTETKDAGFSVRCVKD